MRIILVADESKELESVLPTGNAKVTDNAQQAKREETAALIEAVKTVYPFAKINPGDVSVSFFPKPKSSRNIAWCKCETAAPGPNVDGETFCRVCGGAVVANGRSRPTVIR